MRWIRNSPKLLDRPPTKKKKYRFWLFFMYEVKTFPNILIGNDKGMIKEIYHWKSMLVPEGDPFELLDQGKSW